MIKTVLVQDEFGDPLQGVHFLRVPLLGSTSDSSGKAIVKGNENDFITVSYVGTKTQSYALKNLPERIVMRMDSLDEVTVTAPKPAPTKSYVIPSIIGFFGVVFLMSLGSGADASRKAPKKVTL